MRTTQRRALVAALMVGGGAGLFFLARSAFFRAFPADDFIAKACLEAQARFAEIEVRPVASREDLFQRLASAEVDAATAKLSARQRRSLEQQTVDFLWLRLIHRDRQQYQLWRLALGDTPLPLDLLVTERMAGQGHQTYFSEPLPADADFDALFAQFWDGGWNFGDGFNRPRGLATGAPGIHMASSIATSAQRGGPMHEGTLGLAAWHGAIAHSYRSWFRPPFTMESELAQKSRAILASVAIVADYEAGPRRPISLRFVWSERRQQWALLGVHTSNIVDSRISSLEY